MPPVKVSRLQLALSIACTMLGSIGLTAFAMNALTPATAVKQAATAPDPMVAATRLGDAADEIASVQSGKTKTNATDSNNAPARKRIKPLRSKIVIFNGSKYRQIDFPVECLGEVTSKIAEEECVYANRNYPGPNIHVPALSTRYFPANVPLTFKINLEKYPDALRNIEIVRTIGPDEFEGISLKQCAIDDNSHETQRAFMRQALAMASTWPKLHGLEMQNMQLGDEEMAYIKDMHALRILDLDDTSIEVAALKSSEVLSRINALIVGKVELEPITRGLQYGSRLKFLILDRCDCSARSIDYLHACKQLEIVKVSRSTLSDDVLKSLAGIPNLRQLQIFDYHLSATQLRMLLRSETLKELDLPASNLADARAAGIKDGRLKGLVEVKKGTLLD